ncbi:RNA-splicing factor [Dimargaris cristalligena]|nr:RNA-splicing factor [Dimargaris cristalligena]
MYNGIGLGTARGSGTNGFVVRNLGHLKQRKDPIRPRVELDEDTAKRNANNPFANLGKERSFQERESVSAELKAHKRKRDIEVKCLELRDELEDDGVDEEAIEMQVDALRKKLLAKLKAGAVERREDKFSDSRNRN